MGSNLLVGISDDPGLTSLGTNHSIGRRVVLELPPSIVVTADLILPSLPGGKGSTRARLENARSMSYRFFL